MPSIKKYLVYWDVLELQFRFILADKKGKNTILEEMMARSDHHMFIMLKAGK